MPRKRIGLTQQQRAEFLREARGFHRALCDVCGKAPIGSEEYRRASTLIQGLNALVNEISGRTESLGAPLHRTPEIN